MTQPPAFFVEKEGHITVISCSILYQPLLSIFFILYFLSYFGVILIRGGFIIIILLAFTTHLRVLASSVLKFQDHTQGHTTVGRTPLDE
jgi:hypothetical protein